MTPRQRWGPAAVLAALVYVPLLLTAPGRVGADTKSYLYLDPSRLLSRAWSMWDPSVGLGTVSHQTIGYLWPMGPWFWVFDKVGAPDWVAQRLWLGTILFTAGLGTLWLLRRVLGWTTTAATVAAFAYAFTPYTLTLAARISVILLPYAGLPWMIGMTALAVRRGGWRWPAAFALVIATVGSINATALALAGLGPILWLVHARLSGQASTRAVVGTTVRIGVMTVLANLWWLAGLWAQGSYGIDILRYTETAEVVASSSNGVEVLRGLGYWFFYGGDRLGPWIEPGTAYTQRLLLLALTYAIPIAALALLARTRFKERAFFVALLVVGVIAAVGAHPWTGGPVGVAAIKSFLLSDLGLAMRSLPRAVPLVALALGAGLGAGVDAVLPARTTTGGRNGTYVATSAPSSRLVGAAAVCALLYAALPPLWTGGLVASNLDRPSDVPSYWTDAAAHLDQAGDATRVLEVPGADFASYRWGNTVDPITPGLMDRPYVARELIPYGSAASADLLNALDRRLQERSLDPGALAVIARLMGAGDVVLRDDIQFERFRTPRPYVIDPELQSEPGLGDPVGFGDPTINQPVAQAPLVDDLELLTDDHATRPPVEDFPVTDAEPIVRTASPGSTVVVAGDGEGLVDVASAGLLQGDELVEYGASLGQAGTEAALGEGAELVVTDGNRAQGRRWSTVRDTLGYVEGTPVLGTDLTDNRLPLFPDAEDGWQTTSALPDGTTATATSYGNPISFTPEYRPTNAVDGDVRTEWRTGASSDVRGQRLVVRFPAPGSSVRLVQQLSGARNRHITEIGIRADGGPQQRFTLDDSSLTPDGQVVELAAPAQQLDIEILADSSGLSGAWGRPVRFGGLSQVGFAEVSLVDAPPGGHERLVLPPAAMSSIGPDTPVALVLSRWRTDPSEAVRDDPEPALGREFTLPVDRTFTVAGTARVSARASDEALDELLGVTGPRVTSSSRLAGAISERGSAALDGDPSTWWSPGFGDGAPTITVEAVAPTTIDHLDLALVDDPQRSVPTRLQITADGGAPVVVDVAAGGGRIDLPAPLTGTTFAFTIAGLDERTTTEWFSGAQVVVPPAVADLGIPQLAVDRPATFDTGCRSDLLTMDGAAVQVRITGSTDGAGAVTLVPCNATLTARAGDHAIDAAAGRDTGVDLDRVVLSSGLRRQGGGDTSSPSVAVVDQGRAGMHLHVDGATPGRPFWLVLGQSHNLGWKATGPGVPDGEPALVDGYANGWLVTPTAASFDVDLTWTPQKVVTACLVASLLAVLLCIALIALSLGTEEAGEEPAPAGRRLGLPALSLVGLTVLGTGAFVGPVAALVVAVVGLAAWRWPDRARRLWWLPAALYAAAAAYVVLRQAVSKPTAAFEWPQEQATAHQPALTAVALLVVLLAAAVTPTPPSNPRPEGPPEQSP